jgi:PAS domain S-box-containing protein
MENSIMKNNIVKVVIAAFGVMLVILGVVAVVAVANIRRSTATSDWVNHTHAVMLETDAIVSFLHAGEASLRSYLLTADKRDQAAYRARYNEMVEHLEAAKALTRQEPDSRKQILRIEELVSKRIDLAREVVRSLDLQGKDVAREKLEADAGSILLTEIRSAAQKLIEEQKELLRQRDKASYLQAQATRWTVWTGLGLNFLLLVFLGWMIRDDIAARRKAATALEDANAVLEQKVSQRTAELVKANESLRQENLEWQWSEQAMAHQLRYSDLIINSIDDHIFVISKAINISRVNPAVVHATGYDLPEIIGSPLSRILDIPEPAAGDATAQRRFVQAVKEGREIQGRPGSLLCKNGTVLPMRFNMVPLRDQNKVVGSVLTVRLCKEEQKDAGLPRETKRKFEERP